MHSFKSTITDNSIMVGQHCLNSIVASLPHQSLLHTPIHLL